jgi:twitching motility protein PilT
MLPRRMALLSRDNPLISRIQSESWRTADEMNAMLAELGKGARADQVVPLLFHRVPQVRQAAANGFVQAADDKAIAALLEACNAQRAPQARAFGMQVLAAVPAERLRPAVEAGLRQRDPAKQTVAWEAALQLPGELGVQFAAQAVSAAPVEVRAKALDLLLSRVSAASLKDRLLALLDDGDARMSGRALQALATIDDPQVFEAMLARFTEAKGTARDAAAGYLRNYAGAHPQAVVEPMLVAMAGGDDAVRRLAIEILFGSGQPQQVLQNILVHARGLAPWLRKRLVDTLRGMGDAVLMSAIQLVNHPDEEVRNAALALAEQFDDPRLVEPMCRLLTHEDWWLRIAACDGLGRLKDPRSVPALVQALADEDARWAAVDALSQIGGQQAMEAVARMVHDPRAEVRLDAVAAVGRFDNPQVLQLLEQVSRSDKVLEVRTRAGELLRAMQRRAGVPVAAGETSTTTGATPLEQLLITVRQQGASDVHVTPGEPPIIRVAGELSRFADVPPVTAEQVEQVLMPMLSEEQKAALHERGDLDFCYAIEEVGRYRANVYKTRLGLNACFRVIPNLPPTFSDLLLPDPIAEITSYHQGIVLVTGPAGSGKSTTLAALVNLINEAKPVHIITLEDPVEFVHPQKTALVNQREIGSHSRSFAAALRGALRQDPDVIMVGELCDAETTRMSLEAAETGHLVIATMPTTSAVATIDRLVGSFPPEEQGQVQMALSESVKWVVSQSLMTRRDRPGRVAVFEVLKGTLPVASAIREGKTLALPGAMQTGRQVGMQNVDYALEQHVRAGRISPEDAYVRAESPSNFEALCSPQFLAMLNAARGGLAAEQPAAGGQGGAR